MASFDVVISGISGRFPECNDVETMKKKLYTGNSSEFITINERKWKKGFKWQRYHDEQPIPLATGKYIDKDEFDFRAFKFNQTMAKSTTLLNRKCLEVSFEAIVDAGINPSSLRGANIGVFMAFGVSEDETYCVDNVLGYVFVLGCARTMGPNRVSYALDLKGPSYAITCDPLGSIDVLTLAKRMVQDGSIEGALVVASHQLSSPHYSYPYQYLGFLTSSGFGCTFDENANGYVRSESTVALFLQREQDAKRIYAKINFCDSLYEGSSLLTLLGYDEEYLRNQLLTIYERNGGDAIAAELAFMELNGSAVKKFDSLEANAVADVLFKWRKSPLPIGSIKSSIGHTEASSPFVSLLKIIFALESKIISPNQHFSQPNKDIRAFFENKLQVVDKKTELLGNLAAVNTIGMFGSVNHVVLQGNLKESEATAIKDSLPQLLLISGRTAEGLQKVLQKILQSANNVNSLAMANDVFSTNIPFHIFRGFTVISSTKSIASVIEERGDEKRPICFAFSGMGSQWNGMGKQLMNLPVFADAINRCDAVLRPKSINIYDVILSDDPTMFDNITMSFLGIICMQIALVEVLKKLEIKPDIIVGHSVGENGCAYADGCVTLEQAVLISLARGAASIRTKLIKGMMAAVGKGYMDIKDSLPESIEVACHNSATSCTISGPAEDVNNYVEKLKKEGIFARAVNVSNIAYHSRYIQPAEPKLREILQPLIPSPKKRSSKWISSSVPEEHWSSPLAQTCSAEYFTNNLLNPVLFEEACKHIPKKAIVIEIAPHGLLQAILRRSLPDTCTNISLTKRSTDQENLNTLLTSIGRLYVAGCEPVVNNLYPSIEYPVPRGTPSISPYCTWFYGDCDVVSAYCRPFYSVPLSQERIIVRINEESKFGYLKYHQMNGVTVIPSSFFLYLVWHMLSIHKDVKMDNFPVLFEKITIHKEVKISVSKPRVINILIQGSGSFEVLSRRRFSKTNSKVILTGRIEFIQDENEGPKNNFTLDINEFEYNQDAIDNILRDAGFQLSKCFQSLKNLNSGDSESTANIQWDGNWVTFLDAALKFQMFSDIRKSKLCCLHTVRRIYISPSIIGSTFQGSKICCYYNQVTKEFQCSGIEMNDVKWKTKHAPRTNETPSPLKLRKLKFISYNDPACQTVDEFLELCLQVATEDFQATNETDSSLHICDATKQFIKRVRDYNSIRCLTQFKVSFDDLDSFSSKKLPGNEKLFLITEDDQYLANGHLATDLFVLLITSKRISFKKFSSKFTPLLSQSFSGKMFCLLKKNLASAPEIQIDENNNNLHVGGKKDAKTEVIVRSKLNSSNLSLMLSRKHSKSRYLFVSNTKESSDDCKTPILSKAICSLPVSVLKDQDWGTYRYLQSPKISSLDENNSKNLQINNIQIDSIKTDCIRYDAPKLESDVSDVTPLNSEIELLGVEYSGWNKAGEKIMGLASTCSSYPVAKMDSILKWKVPDGWESTEAVTVPAVYAHVYSVLRIIENTQYNQHASIAIITDSQNIFSRSLISVCLARNLKFYCAVPDEENAKDLKLKILKLNESNVIININNNFDVILRQKTEGRGVNVVVNYLADFKNTQSSLNCVSAFGRVIETVEKNVNESNEFGLQPFLKCCAFFVIPCKITYFLSLPDDQKIHLQNAIKQGIEDGSVMPVFQKPNAASSKECMDQHIDQPSNECNTKSQIPSNTDLKRYSQNMKFVANRSYIIIAGGRRDDTWMKIIQWLRQRDASHFVVVMEKFYSNPRISSQMNNLLSNKKITISFQSLHKLNSVDDAARLVDETNKLAAIDSIFFVSMESSSTVINYLDIATKACKGNVKFISLFAGGVEEMEVRQSKGQPSFVLHGENFPENLPEVLTDFEKMLKNYEPADNQRCIYEILQNSNISDQLTPLRLVLPKSIYDFERIGRNILEEVKFVEMTSRCARLADCKGVYPIFVIPGLHAFELESFCQSLMYPVFCASLTENSSSVHETALKLYEHLITIQKVGPVTIIGETWNAAVAVELSSLIKQTGRKFKAFMLEGNPNEWKNIIRTFNLTESPQFEKVLNKIYGDQILKHPQPEKSLETEDIRNATNRVPNEDRKINSAHVHRCLRLLKQQITNAHKYNFADSMIENTVFFSRQVSHDITLALSDSSDLICVKENDYDSFIQSPEIRKIVNKNALYAW